jgi:hypothetical protein
MHGLVEPYDAAGLVGPDRDDLLRVGALHPESFVRRVGDGISDGLDSDRRWTERGHALGNSIVHQVAVLIFKMILNAEERKRPTSQDG